MTHFYKTKQPALLLFLFVFLAATIPSAKAQTSVSSEMARDYITNCNKQTDERMSKETQDIFCRCTALQMQKNISVEDMQAMSSGDRDAANKILINVYAPCMEFPVRDLIFNKCRKDAYQAGKQICDCMATKVAAYTAEQAQEQLENILKYNPDVYDPMQEIIESNGFQKYEKRVVLECIQEKMSGR